MEKDTATKWTRKRSNELRRETEMGLSEVKGKIINNTYNEVCMECFHICYLEGNELEGECSYGRNSYASTGSH